MAIAELPAWLSGLSALAASAGAAWWLTYNERKKRKEDGAGGSDPASQVVAATFTERALMEKLITALIAVEATVRDSHTITVRLVALLQADEQRRHDEAVVRAALRERGILE